VIVDVDATVVVGPLEVKMDDELPVPFNVCVPVRRPLMVTSLWAANELVKGGEPGPEKAADKFDTARKADIVFRLYVVCGVLDASRN
jgi:hypothetical protein